MVDPSHEVNMVDVAQQAGVSIATVSRALRGLPGVSSPNRNRILQIADELSYVVSPEGSRLARKMTGRVAVVVPKIDIWFYSAMLAGIEEVLRQADLDVLIYQIDGQEQRRRFFQQLPARRKVDAVVLIALPLIPDEERRLDLLGVHVVVAGGRIRDFPHVRVDDEAATRLAMSHLISLGHRRIAMVRTSDTDGAAWSADIIRTQVYTDQLKEHGVDLPDGYLVTSPAGVLAGADGITSLLDLPEPPTAVLAYSDEIAISALAVLARRGVAVPGEMSIMGFDGHPLGEVFGLTTISQSVVHQGRLAGQMAFDLLAGRPVAEESVVVPCELVERGSTGPPAGHNNHYV